MAVRLLMGKRKKARNGYRLHDYNGDGNGYRDDYSEDEDDVFVEEVTSDGLAGMSKPLMHPRHRTKVKSRTPECRCRSVCKPVLYFLLMVTVLGSLVSMLLYALNRHQDTDQSQPPTQSEAEESQGVDGREVLIGCDKVEVEDVWVVGIPKLLTESAFRLVDVNQDGVLDVIIGFATGVDGYLIPPIVCDIYFNGTRPCFGGLLALEGLTGRELWRHYSQHELFALNCNVDLDHDGVLDCLGGGRAAAFEAVSCKEGKLLWTFQDGQVQKQFSNVYTPQYIDDTDGDDVPDLVVVHGGDPLAHPNSKTRESGRVIVMSGRTGKVLSWVGVPEAKESYYSPQVYRQVDGTQVVLFGTGGETHGGSLWALTLQHLKEGRVDLARPLYTDMQKGVMTPPVLVDLTGDGTVDIVMNPFNSTVLAIDGHSYRLLWNRSFPLSESYSTPAAGYFNDDDTPDFLVKAAFGPGYPVYYHAETTVLDGKTGEPLVKPSVRVSVGAQSSALAVSMEGRGHDLFLYWIADCLGHEGEGGAYRFVNGTNVHEQSRSDFCQLRYKSRLFSKLMALSSQLAPPGVAVYYSEERKEVEHHAWVNTTTEAQQFLRQHPHLDTTALRQEMERVQLESLRRKQQLEELAQQGAEYPQQPLPPRGDHFPGAKKGPPPQPPRDSYSSQYSQLPQRRPDQKPALPPHHKQPPPSQQRQKPPPQQQQSQYGGYNFYPFNSNSYGLKDMDNSLYPARTGQSRDDASGFDSQGGYPYNLDQRHEYPAYYSRDRYRLPSSGYEDSYPPYKNYFQKRHLDNTVAGGLLPELAHSGDRGIELLKKALLNSGSAQRGSAESGLGGGRDDAQLNHIGARSKPGNKDMKTGGFMPQKNNHFLGNRKMNDQTSSQDDDILGKSKMKSSSQTADSEKQNSGSLRVNHKQSRSRISSEGTASSSKSSDSSSRHQDRINSDKTSDRPGQPNGSHGQKADDKPPVNYMKRRRRRHVGPHDDSGTQRLLSTGTLAPSTLPPTHPLYPHSIDVVFATYWFFPAKTQAVLPEDQQCIDQLMAKETQRFDPQMSQHIGKPFALPDINQALHRRVIPDRCLKAHARSLCADKYYGMDHDGYGHTITEECLQKSRHQLNDDGVYESQKTYDPFNVHMGQMTVYRLRLKCTCSQVTNSTQNTRCAKILPYDRQRWPAYMGRHGDSFWDPPT